MSRVGWHGGSPLTPKKRPAATGGTMLNRKVASLGTKSSSETKQFTVTISIS